MQKRIREIVKAWCLTESSKNSKTLERKKALWNLKYGNIMFSCTWKCGTNLNACGKQRHVGLRTAGDVAQVQMPEENKDTCRNYELPHSARIPNLSSTS